jgi:hypothetical protein
MSASQLDFVGLKTKEEFASLKSAAEEEFDKKRRCVEPASCKHRGRGA